MAKKIILRARNANDPGNPFGLNNFAAGGWKVRNDDNTGWIQMTPANTKIRNPDHDPAVHAPDDTEFPLYLDIHEG